MALLVTIFLMLVNISTTEHYKGPVVSVQAHAINVLLPHSPL